MLGNCVASYDDSSIGEVEASILDAEERLTPEFYEDLGGRDALDKVRRERSHDSSVLKFRMLLGQHAQNLKVGPNPGDFVSRTLAWAWKPMVILTSKECKALSPLGKHLYAEQRKVREKRSAVVSRARHQFEKGAFDAPIVAFSERCRLPGGGRPIGHISSAEALYNYFVHHFVELQGRVPAALIRAQAITFLTAAAGEGDPDPLPPDWTKAWLANWLNKWHDWFDLTFRQKNKTVSLSHEELLRRLGMFWRNSIRIAAFWYPAKLEWDGFDHTPMTRRICKGKTVAPIGTDKVAPREDHSGDHLRFTEVLFSSSDGRQFKPVICMKAQNPALLKDVDLRKVPKALALQFSPSGSYDERLACFFVIYIYISIYMFI